MCIHTCVHERVTVCVQMWVMGVDVWMPTSFIRIADIWLLCGFVRVEMSVFVHMCAHGSDVYVCM